MRKAIILADTDNVATAIADLSAGDVLDVVAPGGRRVAVEIKDSIQLGHKVATDDIHRGAAIIKYGEVIGRAAADIGKGMHVHVHNLESLRGRGDIN
jgi:altronate dehydratase small subunit